MIKYDFGPNAYFSKEILILRFYGDLQVSCLHRKSCGRTADRVREGSSSTPPIGGAFGGEGPSDNVLHMAKKNWQKNDQTIGCYAYEMMI